MNFRAGDKVRIIKPIYSDNPRLGEIMIVVKASEESGNEEYKLEDEKGGRHLVFVDEIELIQGFRTAKEIKEINKNRSLKNNSTSEEVEDLKTEQKYQKHKEICNRLNELYISKNKEYGDSFGKAYDRLGITSSITQIYHKFERVLEIYDKEDIKYESLEDNLIDTANYIVMLLTELEIEKSKK